MKHMNKELRWLRQHKEFLSMAAIAKYLGVSRWQLTMWINGTPNNKGTAIKLPERCEKPLKEWMRLFNNYHADVLYLEEKVAGNE